ncbi:MAG: mechanosensitive ion channel family protein [Candidatus Saccharimonadales bacterium]
MADLSTAASILLVILGAIVVQVIARESVASLVRRVVLRNKYTSKVEEKKREDTLLHVFRPLNRIVIWVIAVIVALSLLGVNLAALITGAGAAGLVFGIIAQSAFKDYIAGVYLILENQYRVGDVVMLAGTTSGMVEDITIRVTKLRDLDGNLHYVRNGDAGVITNMTTEYSNVNLNIGIGYGDDIDLVEKLINEVGLAMAKEANWQEVITEPIQFLRVDDFAESSVTIKVLGKVQPIHQWEVAGEFRRRIKKVFDKNGIDIPVPQVVIHQAKK